MPDIANLKFIRTDEAVLVPRALLEQIKGPLFNIDDFYKYYFLCNGPFSFLYLIVDTHDSEEPIKGVFWVVVLPVEQALMVNFISVRKEYQRTALFKEHIVPFIEEIRKRGNLRATVGTTTRPKALEKLGYKRVDITIMEKRYG